MTGETVAVELVVESAVETGEVMVVTGVGCWTASKDNRGRSEVGDSCRGCSVSKVSSSEQNLPVRNRPDMITDRAADPSSYSGGGWLKG